MSNKEWYIKNFEQLENSLNGQLSSEVHNIRRKAVSELARLDFPTQRNEEWKYTNPAPLLKFNFVPAVKSNYDNANVEPEIIKLVEKLNADLAVFINGHFSNHLSRLNDGSIRIECLASVMKKEPELVLNNLAKYAEIENGFTALNTAFAFDGAFVHAPKDYIAERPVYLLYLSGDEKKLLASQPRNLIIAGENSQVTIIEDYRSLSDNAHFTNVVTEISLGENSIADYYQIQNENLNSFHISKTQIHQRRNSNFTSNFISLGGELIRNDLNSVLDGEGSECTYNGLYITGGTQHIDNHTLMDHAKPHCQSNELYKGILGGKTKGVFNGKVMVRKDAQKTNAYQSNKNIILSNEALVNTKPQLEIFADDVRCTHGATVGQLSEDEIFYLRARGIDDKDARQMLVHAFANDVIDLIKPDPLREYVNQIVSEKLDNL